MYADYSYYMDTYYGDVFTDETTYNRYASRASDFLDYVTMGKLAGNLPSDEPSLNKIKKAVCVAAEELKAIDQRRAEIDGASTGAVRSISSGGESVSFELSAMDQAITAGASAVNAYLYDKVRIYLSMVSDDRGNLYLDRGLS